MRSAGLVSTATCCLAWFLREPTSPSRTGGTSTTGTLGPREHGSGARPPRKAAPADGSPRSPQRAPPMAAGSAPSIEEGHDTCVAHAQGSEAFALSARPQILFLLCQDEKGEGRCRGFLVPTVATGSHPRCGSPDWPAASVALAKLLAMHIVRPHPQLTKSETLGKGQPPDVTIAPAKHSWLETSAPLERKMR